MQVPPSPSIETIASGPTYGKTKPVTRLMQRLVGFVELRRRYFYIATYAALFLICLYRYWVPYDPNDAVRGKQEMSRIAINLHETSQFANPFYSVDTGPSAHVAPACPLITVLVTHIFGEQVTAPGQSQSRICYPSRFWIGVDPGV